MELLQRLQPLDILFAVLWAAIVGWGLSSGVVRQIGMLVAVYGAALAAGSLYKGGGQGMAMAFGPENQPVLEFVAYVALFFVVFIVLAVIVWRSYRGTRLGRKFGGDNVLGAVVGAVWGVLLLIVLLTIMRYYAVVPWRAQEVSQSATLRQVETSQMAPVLQVVTAPLWAIMVPWFPTQVGRQV